MKEPVADAVIAPFPYGKVLVICCLGSLVGGLVCGFFMNSYISPVLRAASGSCAPLTSEISQQAFMASQTHLQEENQKRILTIQEELIKACVAKGGIPAQDRANGNLTFCGKELGQQPAAEASSPGSGQLKPK
jgi:hypothetical protein